MQGCKCAQCYGLAEYLTDHGMNTHGLPAAPGCGATITNITSGPTHDPRSYTCQCDACRAEIAALMAKRRAA